MARYRYVAHPLQATLGLRPSSATSPVKGEVVPIPAICSYSLRPFTAASYSLRAAFTCGRLLTSGTATSHQ
jgi:hypothetical protein